MTDIVERLRQNVQSGTYVLPIVLQAEAADEIERLRAARAMAWFEGASAASVKVRDMAVRMRRMDSVRLEVLAQASTLELAADAIAELKPAGVGR